MNQIETNDTKVLECMRKANRWRMAFFGLVILLAGVVIGASSAIILLKPKSVVGPAAGPEFVSERMIGNLQRQLRLSPEQIGKVESILKKYMQQLQEIRMNARPRMAEQLQLMNDEISAVLTEQQRRIWQERMLPIQRQLRQRGPRHGDGLEGPPYRRGQRGLGGGASPNLPAPNEPLNR